MLVAGELGSVGNGGSAARVAQACACGAGLKGGATMLDRQSDAHSVCTAAAVTAVVAQVTMAVLIAVVAPEAASGDVVAAPADRVCV